MISTVNIYTSTEKLDTFPLKDSRCAIVEKQIKFRETTLAIT